MKNKKILILCANPTDTKQLRLDKEVREIENALLLAKNPDKFEIAAKWAVRVEDLRRALLEYQPTIVHFCGHGEEEGLVLENENGTRQTVSAESLGSLFESFREFVECVLLNACYSEVQAQAIYKYVDCVIGMNQPIGDKAAIEFATGFYDALGHGENYDYAFQIGLDSIGLKGSSEYSTPVIKYRPSSVRGKNNSSAMDEVLQQPGDKVGGDKITVGDISDSKGIAIGRNSSAIVNCINQLQNSNNLEAQELADLLKQLKAEIEKENSGLIPKNHHKALKHLTNIGNFGSHRQNSDFRDDAETALDALPTILNQATGLNKTDIATLLTKIEQNLGL